MTIIIGHFLRNTKEALGNLLFNMANSLTCRSLVFQMINGQTLNKKSFCFIKITNECLKLFIKVMTEVNVTIIFFAQARELSKVKSTTAQLPQTLFGHNLRSMLVDQFNLLAIGNTFILAVNENYISDSSQITLKEKDIVAVIPPISGGSNQLYFKNVKKKMIDLKIVNSELDISSAMNSVNSPQCGAISIFIGTTREHFNGNKVKTLFYEAYESMALNEMKSITVLTRQKWPEVVNIAIHHRIGEVKVREASVVIAASSPHRKHAQEAVSFILERLKTTVPIFKKEQYEDGSGVWKANEECAWKSNN